jgi:fumarate reductase subunit C
MKSKHYISPWKSPSWWLKRPTWFRYALREASAVVVLLYVVFLLVLLGRAADASSFAAFYQALRSPASLVLHLIGLAFLLYHAATWFHIAAQALPIWRGERRISPTVVAVLFCCVWLVVAASLLWLALWR